MRENRKELIYVTKQDGEEVCLTRCRECFESICVDGVDKELVDSNLTGELSFQFMQAGEHRVYVCLKQEAVDLSGLFEGCSRLVAIPGDLFGECREVESFERCFAGTGIYSVPVGLFHTCVKAKNFSNCFMWCGDLYEIPDDLFGMCVEAEDFSGCFTQSGIERIPEGLFDRCVKAKDFSWCFNDCASLEVVPENLFAYCGEVENVEGCFGGECGVEVSEDIFQGCKKVKKNWGFFF